MTIVIDVGSFFKFFGYFMLVVAAGWFIYIIYKIAEHLFLETIKGIKWAVLHPVQLLKLLLKEGKATIQIMGIVLLGFGLYLGSVCAMFFGAGWIAVQIWGYEAVDYWIPFIMLGAFVVVLGTLWAFSLGWFSKDDEDKKEEELDD